MWLTYPDVQFSIRGRHALVTGGNSGIGLALATGLARAGANVLVFDVTPPSAEFSSIAAQYSVRTDYRKVDVSSVRALREGFEEAVKPFCDGSGLDICLVVAGINHLHNFLEADEETFDRLVGVNVKGAYFTCQLAAQVMGDTANTDTSGAPQSSKSIVVIASTNAHVATRSHNSSIYCTTKSAVKGMIPELAKELGGRGIRINSISPGYTLTNMTKNYPELIEKWEQDTMLGFIGQPQDYVGAAIFLSSDASRYMTAQDILIDGGMTKW